MTIILAGDFNISVKVNDNAELVEFMRDTFELDVLSDVSQGTSGSNFALIWTLDEMWTINRARTTFRTLPLRDLS
jgi:hypothetical protein